MIVMIFLIILRYPLSTIIWAAISCCIYICNFFLCLLISINSIYIIVISSFATLSPFQMKSSPATASCDYQVVDYLINQFKGYLGKTPAPPKEQTVQLGEDGKGNIKRCVNRG